MKVPYLIGHFIYNLWGAPHQDNQSIIRPARITPFGGARNHVHIFSEDYNLPTKHDRYHAYVLGQVFEPIVNLPFIEYPERSEWVNMAEYCKETNVLFQFYTVKGTMIPLTHIYFTTTVEKNIVIVIREETKIPWDMDSQDITFRTYRNALYTTPGPNQPAEKTDILYLKLIRMSQRTIISDFYRQYERKPGKIFTYINGYIVDNPISYPILEGDVVELIYDSTIYKTVEININQTPTFKSILDGIRKYLFTHDKSYRLNTFEYFDDCDFYLSFYHKNSPKMFKGVLLHRNNISNVRQVTNCDFSISTNLVKELIHDHEFIDQAQGRIVFQVHYRKQYRNIRFPYNAHRLHELNKLPYRNRTAALLGVNSNIQEWRADVLENSDLMKLVSLDKPICDIERIQNAYGYNAVTWYTAKSVHPYKDFVNDGLGGKVVNVPYTFRHMSTIFEYDETGKLLQWSRLGNYNQYPVKDTRTRYVEFIGGVGTRQPYHYFGEGKNKFTIATKDSEYRFYGCKKELLNENQNDYTVWEDITDKVMLNKSYDEQTDETKIWLTDKYETPSSREPMYNTVDKYFIYRTDDDFLCRDIEARVVKNNLSFTLTQVYWDIDEEKLKEQPVKVPYGYLDVFLNGYALIEGIDYFVDFPKVHIISKGCIDFSLEKQKITFRMYGFPDTKNHTTVDKRTITQLTGILNANRQVGYVNNGMLSKNNKWDILEEKNLLVKVGNGIIAKEDLGFSEDGSVIPNRRDALEGKPYEIVDVISGKRDTYPKDTYQFKKEAEVLDKKISDYMTMLLPETRTTTNPPIHGLYKLFSPLLSRLIYDLSENLVNFPNMESRYLDQEVIDFIEANYQEFFKIEPSFKLDLISLKHVTIHPVYKNTVTDITYHQMRWLKQVVRIYYRNSIELSHFVRIGEQYA